MSSGQKPQSTQAVIYLTLATLFWATSFPVMRALGMHQENLVHGARSMFVPLAAIFGRFLVATLVLVAWRGRAVTHCSRLEIWQGASLGFFGGIGIVLQMDGLLYVDASVSAFLTQCYCLWVPLFLAFRHRACPSRTLALACIMVLAGVAELSNLHLSHFNIGRGEAETILASIFFTGQILLLERPAYSANRAVPVTMIMFAVTALLILPVAAVSGAGWSPWRAVYSTPASIGLTVFLGTLCSVVPYTIMNRWQQHIPAAHASLIYTFEPLLASVFALFMPGWLSHFASVDYPNETMGTHLILGGGLVIAANILVLWKSAAR
jgi:drug/metabolite transporter (DMT)-like permease